MQRIRVLVVDDHRIFAESLAAALAAEQDVEVGAAGSGPAALRHLERGAAEGRRFDILLVDADLGAPLNGSAQPGNGALPAPVPIPAQAGPLGPGTARTNGEKPAAGTPLGAQDEAPPAPGGAPGGSGGAADPPSPAATVGGLPLVARVRTDYPAVRTVVLAERDDPRHAPRGAPGGRGRLGRQGLLPLPAPAGDPGRPQGRDPPAARPPHRRPPGVDGQPQAPHRERTPRGVADPPREREVLRCMVAGLGRKAVAERLYLSPHTVRTHMQNVLGKLGVHSTLQAVALARRAGVGPAELEPVGAR